jgi:hypothetical protein
MKKYKVVTNESFEKYIDYITRGRGRRFEDRFDTLDLDDITADVNVPSEGEVDAAVRELDLFDDAAVKTGAGDVEVGGDGKLRLLDFDDNPSKKSRNVIGTSDKADARIAGLDLDDNPSKNGNKASTDKEDDDIRELDLDDKGKDVKDKKSNVGAIGALDYDDDIDTSKLAASIEDVYVALASEDPKTVKAMIKRYASDITDKEKIKEIMLAHAVKLNYDSLRVMCGDMKVTLTAKEKELGFIDRNDIKDALARFKSIASTLTGENNTYGLIPNAIVSCSPEDQIKCINIIDFLVTWCNLPIMPIYFRGSMTRRLYDVASYLSSEMDDVKFDEGFLTGSRGLLTRIKNYDDVPKKLIEVIAERMDTKKLSSRIIGDFVIMCLSNKNNAAAKKAFANCSANKRDMIIDYIDDNDMAAYQKVVKLLKIKVD